MEDFIKKGNDIQTITTENLNIQYENMIKEHQKYLYKTITSTIQHHIRGISATDIESLIDRYLFTDLKYRGLKTIDKLCEGITNDIDQVIKNSKNKDKNELLRRYSEYINPTIRRNQMDWIYEITNQFSKQIIEKIKRQAIPFNGISDENLKRTINALDKELEQVMKNYQEKFNEEYQPHFKKFIEDNKRQITELITEIDLFNKKTENLQMYSAIIELSNHNLIVENGKLYVQNNTDNSKIELTIKNDEKNKTNMLISQDEKIRYSLDVENKRIGYYNNETKVAILVHNGLITLIPPKKEQNTKLNVISFKKEKTKKNGILENNYFFYYNLKLVNENELLKSVIEQIEKYTPGIYNKLISDKDFVRLLNKINTQNKDITSETKENNQSTEEIQQQTNSNLEDIVKQDNTKEQSINVRTLKQ